MSVLFDNAVVQKSNTLNELRCNNMSLQELRFFSIYLSKINQSDLSTRIVRFPIEDFRSIMGLGKLNLMQLKTSTDNLLCKLVHVPEENRKGFRTYQLFKECGIFQDYDGEWYVEIDAHDKVLPLMFELKNKYFSYKLWNALRLKSVNQLRMYEILQQWLNKKSNFTKEFEVEELRELLGIKEHEYSGRTGWSDFKKNVLDVCQEALKSMTDLCFTYERGKTGRGGKWLSVIFHIKKNTEYTDPLTLENFLKENSLHESEIKQNENIQVENQISFFDEECLEPDFDNDRLEFLVGACGNEFSESQMQLVSDLIVNKILPETSSLGVDFDRYDYLQEMYSKLNVYAEKNKITDRFAYFCKMIENDDRY